MGIKARIPLRYWPAAIAAGEQPDTRRDKGRDDGSWLVAVRQAMCVRPQTSAVREDERTRARCRAHEQLVRIRYVRHARRLDQAQQRAPIRFRTAWSSSDRRALASGSHRRSPDVDSPLPQPGRQHGIGRSMDHARRPSATASSSTFPRRQIGVYAGARDGTAPSRPTVGTHDVADILKLTIPYRKASSISNAIPKQRQ